ncbi:unnamed protein product [Moneuplotes crassus]|uniref:SWIM-type domain-containing protein n=1 Tax=Euplotes crassus TaxID=5936 RepID=A0AAD2DAC9_EUPCR|nr:unnamed protein product [Moneuplotes crassus]
MNAPLYIDPCQETNSGGKYSQYFVDFSKFPVYFNTPKEACDTYNGLGLSKKIHFKKYNIKRNENDFVTGFTLCCHKKNIKNKAMGNVDENGNPIEGGDCPVMVKFAWDLQRQCYVRVCSPVMKHNHKPEIKNRLMMTNSTVRNEVKCLVKAGLSSATIASIMSHKYQTTFQYGFIYQQARRIKFGNLHDRDISDAEKIICMLEELKAQDPDTDWLCEYEKDGYPHDLNKIIVMTGKMKRFYLKYHDVVFMDATYKTNKHDMALTIFSGVNCDGRNTVLGYALVKKETAESYKWLLSNLVKLSGVEPGVILTDFDPSMCHGIERIFRNTTHLLCQWHMMCNFKRHFFYLRKKRSGAAKILHQKIIDTIFCRTPKEFHENQEIIFSSDDLLDPQKMGYLRKMFSIKEKWAAAFTPALFHAGTHTISRAESVNSQVKSKVFRRSSLCDIFKLMNDIIEKCIKKSVLDRTQCKEKHQIHHPLLKSIYENYSSFAYNHMMYQYMLSHSLIVKKIRSDGDECSHSGQYMVKDVDDREKYTVEIFESPNPQVGLTINCKCKFRVTQRLYCAHILATMNACQIKTCEKFEPEDRWLDKLDNFLPEPDKTIKAIRNGEDTKKEKHENSQELLNSQIKKEESFQPLEDEDDLD